MLAGVTLVTVGCQGGSVRAERAKWQNPAFFEKHRSPLYNAFVENGGMKKKSTVANAKEMRMKNGLSRELGDTAGVGTIGSSVMTGTVANSDVRQGNANAMRPIDGNDTGSANGTNGVRLTSVVAGVAPQTQATAVQSVQRRGVDDGVHEEQIRALQSELKQEPLKQDGFINLAEVPQR